MSDTADKATPSTMKNRPVGRRNGRLTRGNILKTQEHGHSKSVDDGRPLSRRFSHDDEGRSTEERSAADYKRSPSVAANFLGTKEPLVFKSEILSNRSVHPRDKMSDAKSEGENRTNTQAPDRWSSANMAKFQGTRGRSMKKTHRSKRPRSLDRNMNDIPLTVREGGFGSGHRIRYLEDVSVQKTQSKSRSRCGPFVLAQQQEIATEELRPDAGLTFARVPVISPRTLQMQKIVGASSYNSGDYQPLNKITNPGSVKITRRSHHALKWRLLPDVYDRKNDCTLPENTK
ncbi:uncharacterized protein [Amphiura filiformis]|uniref:uncharacterized protein n=1 Tax=Amphiura filiformis TaxID=82378 RepID=UPI003B224449